jgi:hypothetical protein
MRTQAIVGKVVTCTPILIERAATGSFYWARVQTFQTIVTIERQPKRLLSCVGKRTLPSYWEGAPTENHWFVDACSKHMIVGSYEAR